MNLRLVLISICIGAVIGLAATVSIDLLVESAITVAVPREDMSKLTPAAINEKLRSGDVPLKSVRGIEKDIYVLKYEPMVLVRRWLYFFFACTLAAFVSGMLSKQHRGV
jgi:hypothetical protein